MNIYYYLSSRGLLKYMFNSSRVWVRGRIYERNDYCIL